MDEAGDLLVPAERDERGGVEEEIVDEAHRPIPASCRAARWAAHLSRLLVGDLVPEQLGQHRTDPLAPLVDLLGGEGLCGY
ncbi:hypothetical protein [Streptomyces roseochromogenus]|uniref:Uncharacterized protein n=1 Tax=Streptomyces roseochromogenus subsp. oscitans DS 12.976 TaxID=1352936 RepID=V6K199_STRRC|nr:hypothetical protein [Streptomyces roseochromogenus]EST25828.1 hypothetical protein M878_27880 [Streptomyces roseochromogenus subsp. oscitans DS 12.976]